MLALLVFFPIIAVIAILFGAPARLTAVATATLNFLVGLFAVSSWKCACWNFSVPVLDKPALNLSFGFIDGMSVHHQGAVNMAQDVLKQSKRQEMKKLATNIIAAQKREINQMKEWRKTWYPKADNTPMAYHAQMGHMMAMTPEQMQSMMMTMDLGAADDQFDLRFLNAMIPHHEGALVMAQDALKKSKRPEMKKLSEEILTSQKKEILQMKEWRKTWYKQ